MNAQRGCLSARPLVFIREASQRISYRKIYAKRLRTNLILVRSGFMQSLSNMKLKLNCRFPRKTKRLIVQNINKQTTTGTIKTWSFCFKYLYIWFTFRDIWRCNQKFPDWPPGARTANGTAVI